MQLNILEIILIVISLVLVATVVLRVLHLPTILGYILIGAICGPHALRLIPDVDTIRRLAEFGVVFLMFTVGLEFSFKKLLTFKRAVFFLGTAQILISIVITTIAAIAFGLSFWPAIIIGGVVAMSSTAIVMKLLHDQRQLNSKYGHNAVGILLLQDLAVIPFLILIANLSGEMQGSITYIITFTTLKSILALIIIIVLGNVVLKPLFDIIAATRVIELFTLTVLLVVIGMAWITHILGLSLALGAFLGGMMLSESQHRLLIESEIRPFRDVLLGLFFLTIGMLVDISTWADTWGWISLLLIALLLGKSSLITLLCRISGDGWKTAAQTGLVLAQGGEFGFAILTVALKNQLLSDEYGQVILSALFITIAVAPIFIYFNDSLTKIFNKK